MYQDSLSPLSDLVPCPAPTADLIRSLNAKAAWFKTDMLPSLVESLRRYIAFQRQLIETADLFAKHNTEDCFPEGLRLHLKTRESLIAACRIWVARGVLDAKDEVLAGLFDLG